MPRGKKKETPVEEPTAEEPKTEPIPQEEPIMKEVKPLPGKQKPIDDTEYPNSEIDPKVETVLVKLLYGKLTRNGVSYHAGDRFWVSKEWAERSNSVSTDV